MAVAEQEVAAAAVSDYYEAVAAREALRFALDLVETAQSLATYCRGRAKEALIAAADVIVGSSAVAQIGLMLGPRARFR